MITDIYANSGYDTITVTKVLSDLKEKQYVIYQFKSNNFLRLTDKFSSKIEQIIEAYKEKLSATLTAKQVLNDYNNYNYLYPTGYNDDNEITRYFDFTFITDEELLEVDNWDVKISDCQGVGEVYGIILSSEDNHKAVIKAISEINHSRIAFVIPNMAIDVMDDCLEYRAVSMLKNENSDDEVLAEELELRIEDNDNILSNFVSMFLLPEMRAAEWYYNGKKQRIFRKTQISELLSSICRELYTQTPIIKNEMINKNSVSKTIINAMNKVVDALLVNELRPNLGLVGSGPDVSIMRSVLVNTGILKDYDTMPKLSITGDNEDKYQNVLSIISEFFKEANNTSFAELYDILISPEHHIGLKKGVIPVFIAVALNPIRQYVVICKNGMEMDLSSTLLNAINDKPEDYVVFMENWDKQKEEYIQRLEQIFSDHILMAEKETNNFGYVARAMQRWLASLPKYAKEMTRIYKGSKLDREKIKFINACRNKERFILMKIPERLKKIFDVPDDCPKYDKKKPDYRCIANSPYRKKKALEQLTKEICSAETIIEHTISLLNNIGIQSTCIKCRIDEVDYSKIKSEYRLNSEGHIVWMKFIKEGHLGVVAAGKDVNYGYEQSSGKLMASIKREWDKSFVLLFPLPNISDEDRHVIERGIVNYLISKKIPIIDYYSHNM